MKILVFSDSHGHDRYMKRVMEMHAADTDLVIHLGDGKKDLLAMMQSYPGIGHACVNGNFEDPFCRSAEICTVIESDGLRILLTHGHYFNVNHGLTRLIYEARERECDIALYGHTHVQDSRYFAPDDTFVKPLYVVNPGSISLPRDGRIPKYAVIKIVRGQPPINCAALTREC